MNYITSNKTLLKMYYFLILISIGVIFWKPAKEFNHPLANLNFHHFYDLFNNNEMIRAQIKLFATHGLLLVLLGFVILGAFILYGYNRQKLWSLKFLTVTVLFLLLGAVGPFLSKYQKNVYFEISAPMQHKTSGQTHIEIQFEVMDKKLLEYLLLAKERKIKCYITTHLINNYIDYPIKINDSMTVFDKNMTLVSPYFIQNFLKSSILNIDLNLKNPQTLVYRALPKDIKTRKDSLIIDGKRMYFSEHFLIFFKFENLEGKPLAVFL